MSEERIDLMDLLMALNGVLRDKSAEVVRLNIQVQDLQGEVNSLKHKLEKKEKECKNNDARTNK